jgi:hypothetical protein
VLERSGGVTARLQAERAPLIKAFWALTFPVRKNNPNHSFQNHLPNTVLNIKRTLNQFKSHDNSILLMSKLRRRYFVTWPKSRS